MIFQELDKRDRLEFLSTIACAFPLSSPYVVLSDIKEERILFLVVTFAVRKKVIDIFVVEPFLGEACKSDYRKPGFPPIQIKLKNPTVTVYD